DGGVAFYMQAGAVLVVGDDGVADDDAFGRLQIDDEGHELLSLGLNRGILPRIAHCRMAGVKDWLTSPLLPLLAAEALQRDFVKLLRLPEAALLLLRAVALFLRLFVFFQLAEGFEHGFSRAFYLLFQFLLLLPDAFAPALHGF